MKNILLDFEAIGTHWHIDLIAEPERASELSRLITNHIIEFDKNYSRFRPDSWLRTTANKPGSHITPTDFGQMIELYQKMNKITKGAVTPLIGDALERAGYDDKYSLKPSALKPIPKLEDVLDYEHNTLHVKYSIHLDFGAAGKGYLVDQVADLLKKQGITTFTVDAGGDILHHSPANSSPLEVGLEDPNDPSKAIGIVKINNVSLCGSAGNRRKWADFHHIINPHTLKSEDSIRAVWVIAKTTLLADGMSTCLFFTNPKVLQKEFDFEYLLLDAKGQLNKSAGFLVSLFGQTKSKHPLDRPQ